MSHLTGGCLSLWCWFKSLTALKVWLHFSTPHLNVLVGCILLGTAKFFVTKVPFFSFFAGALSGVVIWLSVDSVVSLFSIESSSVQSNCGVCAGAGIDAELVGWSVTSFCLSVTVSRLSLMMEGALIPIGTKAEFSAVMSFSGITSLPKLSSASIATFVSSLLAAFVIVEGTFRLIGRGVVEGLVW